MKSINFAFFLFILFTGKQASAQTYIPSDNGSAVKFTIKNFGFGVDGSFKNLKGIIVFDPANIGIASFKVTVDAATVNTGNASRDGHLKKEEYFDVAKYPTISFTSSKIEKTAQGYLATGVFAIKDKSKIVIIPFTAIPQSGGFLFTGKVQLNRRDFGVGGSSMVLSDNLNLMLTIKAQK
jgi:polyisoprenoid-binding protein YceI